MQSTYRQLLGFDARENEQDSLKTPLPEFMREEFLLRPEVEQVFSVDKSIWPTHFLYHPQIRHLMPPQHHPPLIETDQDCGWGLWLNLAMMRQRISDCGRSAVLIAIELLACEGEGLSGCSTEYSSPLIYQTPDPESVPDGSIVLGFDVADEGMLSGLSNCGYTLEQREELRPVWRGKINDFGLLQREEDAFEFMLLTDARVDEHAPFWVYKLYQLPNE